MKNRILALITSGMILSSATALPPVHAALTPTNDTTIGELPKWIPNDLDSAIRFRDEFGGTHIDDGLICIVFKEQNEKIPDGEPRGMLRYILEDESDNCMLLKREVYGSKDSDYNYEVLVYTPLNKGDFEVTLTDTWPQYPSDIYYPDGKITYTFSTTADPDALSTKETDIYSWLPDCFTEYCFYVNSNGSVSRKDNNVVLCLESDLGASHEWCVTPGNMDTSIIDYLCESSCNEESDKLLDGGIQYRIVVYHAKKDGHATISYDYIQNNGLVYRPDEVEKRLVADCQIIDNAQTVLFSGDMRVKLVDYKTGELIPVDKEKAPSIWTNISYNTPEGKMSTGPIYEIEENPIILRNISSFLNADSVSFGLRSADFPKGYRLPGNDESSGYYNGTIIPDDYMTVTRYENGSSDVIFRLSNEKDPSAGETKITFYDADTGELLDISKEITIMKELMKDPFPVESYSIESNPATIDSGSFYDPSWRYTINTRTKAGSYSSPVFKVTSENDKLTELSCTLKFTPNGDANGDGKLSIADATLFQKWLMGGSDLTIAEWKSVDFCHDNKLDIFDFCLMRQKLIMESIAVVPPEKESVIGGFFSIVGSDQNLYSGPGTEYSVIEQIPQRELITERGFIYGNEEWVYADHNGKLGWIRVYIDDPTNENIEFTELEYDKPVIYLYPEQETDIHVDLQLTTSDLATTYPKYDNGWDVTAYPDGTLLNIKDGTHHRYLFWDSINCKTVFDLSKGFCVAGSDTESFLKEKLTYMGLSEEEMNEFIVYWLPRMEHNRYNLISFQGRAYTDSAVLDITPAPDSILRIFMTYIPLENAVDIEPQELETFERKGFTVVEWGGNEISPNK